MSLNCDLLHRKDDVLRSFSNIKMKLAKYGSHCMPEGISRGKKEHAHTSAHCFFAFLFLLLTLATHATTRSISPGAISAVRPFTDTCCFTNRQPGACGCDYCSENRRVGDQRAQAPQSRRSVPIHTRRHNGKRVCVKVEV